MPPSPNLADARQPRRSAFLVAGALLAGGAIGRGSAPGPEASAALVESSAARPAAEVATVRAVASAPAQPVAPRRAAAAAQPCEPTDEVEDERHRRQKSQELIQLLDRELATAAAFGRGQPVEAVVNRSQEYLRGLVEGLTRVAPDLADELAAEVEQSLCADQSSDAKLMLMARLGLAMPEVMTSRGIDCVVVGRDAEDVVLWAALDAWRQSGLPRSEALVRLEARAGDDRTKRRFLSLLDQHRPSDFEQDQTSSQPGDDE